MTYKITEHNVATNEIIERQATADEIQYFKAREEKLDAIAKADSDKAVAKSALLEKLGITAEEATLLLS